MCRLLFVVCLAMSGIITKVNCSAGKVWTYRGKLGPDHWHLDYPHCGGVKQSPISIQTNEAIVDVNRLKPIVLKNYGSVPNNNYTIENNGHTVKVTLNEDYNEISGGGLPGTFVASQFHFHWGTTDKRGSEHDVNRIHFPMEMHIVHFNKKYDNISTAVDKDDGLAVLGFFFQIGRYNKHMHEVIRHFKQIKYKGTHVDISPEPLARLVPDDLSKFFRYEGSLTTPPCYESVTWTLFNKTIEIAEEQLQDFRQTILENTDGDNGIPMDISDDFRPAQCLFRRRVYASHPSLRYSDHFNTDFNNLNSSKTVVGQLSFLMLVLTMINLL
ncbi:carbonic anhydrase 1-like [Ruditapes philippinarum]|uniref:carbonic anhydrase 1-like n=1 Tax=Ruditapes philippinarum TaxID=129788 RepID=UPI00295BF71E|nr:carbonic anhydrase 1-like [Ruditapes philippinarum]